MFVCFHFFYHFITDRFVSPQSTKVTYFVCVSINLASVLAIRMSHASEISNPAGKGR
jgi:hypothetical protein